MSCNFDCDQGKQCRCRPYTLTTTNSDGNDPNEGYSGYVQDLVYTAVHLSGAVILLAVALAGLAYGLRAAGWI